MRVFVAVPLPRAAVDDLGELLAPRQEVEDGPRWTPPDQWHVTLAFMGDAPADRVDDLVEGLAGAASRTPGMPLRVCGAGCFPDVPGARVLWAGVEDPAGGLPPLARRVRSAANRAGAAPDGGRFTPHLTLGRFRRPTEATRWVRVLDLYAGPWWTADHLALVQSHLGEGPRGRPRHEVVAEVPLG
ncbi:MAG TPA: RNA 2',3'-cyclic phosphodiesterase [Dermatophilaceae bacterium]|nr:RNA 2',3'-cyclic phosphodiesterase [Dermatophilaceae bacterium]